MVDDSEYLDADLRSLVRSSGRWDSDPISPSEEVLIWEESRNYGSDGECLDGEEIAATEESFQSANVEGGTQAPAENFTRTPRDKKVRKRRSSKEEIPRKKLSGNRYQQLHNCAYAANIEMCRELLER